LAGLENLPRSLRAYAQQPEVMRKKVNERIRGMAAEMKGRLPEWDAMNQPFDKHTTRVRPR
jgi:hypothetical protein